MSRLVRLVGAVMLTAGGLALLWAVNHLWGSLAMIVACAFMSAIVAGVDRQHRRRN